MLKTHMFAYGSLPENWRQFEESGAYVLSEKELNDYREAYPNGSYSTDMKVLQTEVLQESLVIARTQLSAWNDELAAARKPLDELKGDLRAQLTLFFDPKFDMRVAMHFIDDLQHQQGVTPAAVKDFLHAGRLLRDADFFLNHPIGPINDSRLNDVLKLRAMEQYQKSREDLEKFRDDILRQVEAHDKISPGAQNATRP